MPAVRQRFPKAPDDPHAGAGAIEERTLHYEKPIRILTGIAIAFTAISMALLLVAALLNGFLAEHVHNVYSPEDVTIMLDFPLFFKCCMYALGMLLILLVGGNTKLGIWAEVFILAAMAIVFPWLVDMGYDVMIQLGDILPGSFYHSWSAATMTSQYVMHPANLAVVIAYVACGMSIAAKCMDKQKASADPYAGA